jgi:hypothetical protein
MYMNACVCMDLLTCFGAHVGMPVSGRAVDAQVHVLKRKGSCLTFFFSSLRAHSADSTRLTSSNGTGFSPLCTGVKEPCKISYRANYSQQQQQEKETTERIYLLVCRCMDSDEGVEAIRCKGPKRRPYVISKTHVS